MIPNVILYYLILLCSFNFFNVIFPPPMKLLTAVTGERMITNVTEETEAMITVIAIIIKMIIIIIMRIIIIRIIMIIIMMIITIIMRMNIRIFAIKSSKKIPSKSSRFFYLML